MGNLYILFIVSSMTFTNYSLNYIELKLIKWCNIISTFLILICFLIYLNSEESNTYITNVAESVYAIGMFANAFYLAYLKLKKDKKSK